jgi:hypothetical protein
MARPPVSNQHAYWHFNDINFSPDGTPLPPPDPVDLVTQLRPMIAALPPSPVHRTITLLRPRVDSPLGRGCSPTASRGGQIYCSDPERRHGRQRRVCHSGERRDDCTARLLGSHRWRLFLAARQISDADTNDGIARIVVNKVAVQVSNPEAWINDSAELAKQFAYAVPVSTGTKFRSYREYETNVRNIARAQAALAAAGWRT